MRKMSKHHPSAGKGFNNEASPEALPPERIITDKEALPRRIVSPSKKQRSIPGETTSPAPAPAPKEGSEASRSEASREEPPTTLEKIVSKHLSKEGSEASREVWLLDPDDHCLSQITFEQAESLLALDRTPFREIMANILQCGPTDQAMRKFANIHPDRWARCVELFAQMGGFSEKKDLTVHHEFEEIQSMSDSELEDSIRELDEEMEARGLQKTISINSIDEVD